MSFRIYLPAWFKRRREVRGSVRFHVTWAAHLIAVVNLTFVDLCLLQATLFTKIGFGWDDIEFCCGCWCYANIHGFYHRSCIWLCTWFTHFGNTDVCSGLDACVSHLCFRNLNPGSSLYWPDSPLMVRSLFIKFWASLSENVSIYVVISGSGQRLVTGYFSDNQRHASICHSVGVGRIPTHTHTHIHMTSRPSRLT